MFNPKIPQFRRDAIGFVVGKLTTGTIDGILAGALLEDFTGIGNVTGTGASVGVFVGAFTGIVNGIATGAVTGAGDVKVIGTGTDTGVFTGRKLGELLGE